MPSGDLLQRGIYSSIAVAMKGGAWREASVVMLAQAVAASSKDGASSAAGGQSLENRATQAYGWHPWHEQNRAAFVAVEQNRAALVASVYGQNRAALAAIEQNRAAVVASVSQYTTPPPSWRPWRRARSRRLVATRSRVAPQVDLEPSSSALVQPSSSDPLPKE